MRIRISAAMIPVAILMGAFLLFGFAILGYGLWSARRSHQAESWPTTDGTIVNVELDERTDSDGDTTYQVKVAYTYTVAGNAYHSSRLAFGYGGSNDKAVHEEIFARLKNARTVTVRYDPLDPSIATLSCGFHYTIKFLLTFAAVWLVFTAGFIWMFWMANPRDKTLLDNLLVR